MPNITKSFVRTAKCEEGKTKQEYYDNELKGFMLEVKANNRKTFYLRVTTKDDKRQSIKLKRSIEEGKDVIIDAPEVQETVPTLQSFYEEQYIPFVKQYNKSWDKNASLFLIHILPDLGKYPMDKITPPMIAKNHVAMVEKKKLSNSSANKYLIFLRHAYNLAIEWKLKGITDNPATKVKLFEERIRERFITPKEANKH